MVREEGGGREEEDGPSHEYRGTQGTQRFILSSVTFKFCHYMDDNEVVLTKHKNPKPPR